MYVRSSKKLTNFWPKNDFISPNIYVTNNPVELQSIFALVQGQSDPMPSVKPSRRWKRTTKWSPKMQIGMEDSRIGKRHLSGLTKKSTRNTF